MIRELGEKKQLAFKERCRQNENLLKNPIPFILVIKSVSQETYKRTSEI